MPLSKINECTWYNFKDIFIKDKKYEDLNWVKTLHSLISLYKNIVHEYL